jgi:predicted DNA-binding transcriptional regulator AlpA
MPDDIEFWSLKTVMQKVGRSRSQIYRMIADGEFPAQRKYRNSEHSVFWLSTDVRAWMAGQLSDVFIG